MKRLLCIVMTLCLCASLAWAEELDYSAMTDEQLLEALNSIRFELLKRSLLVSFEEKVDELRITALNWTRTINIEEKRMFSESGWTLPDGAEQTDAKEEIHHYDQVMISSERDGAEIHIVDDQGNDIAELIRNH